jgi:hypothetical protein
MDESPDQVYAALLHKLANPLGTEPEALAAMFRDIERMHSMGQIADWQLHNAREAYARAPGSKAAEVASWALEKATEGVHAGVDLVRDSTRSAVTKYTLRDPMRAILIAAATGAVLMALASMLARTGARKLRRNLDE